MFLLIITTCISFLSGSTSTFTKPIVQWLNKPTSKEKELYQEISKLKKEQNKISMVDNFAAHAKIQRKINSITLEINKITSGQTGKKYATQFSVAIGSKLVLALIMLYIVFFYRYEPVYIFPSEYNFYPMSPIMSYPNDIPNAVSVHFWLIVCNCVVRLLAK